MTKFLRYLVGDMAAEKIVTKPFDNEHWYMADGICRLLGIENHSQAVKNHLDGSEWRKETTYIGGYGKKHILLINNSGVIKLIQCGRGAKAHLLRNKLKSMPAHRLPENQQHLMSRLAA